MLLGLNLLHLLLVLGAALCVRLALREIGGRAMSPSRLAALPLMALAMTFVFFLFFLSLRQPVWLFPGALLLGVAIGAARGLTMTLRYDHMWRLVRPSRHKVLLWVTLALNGAVVLEAAGSVIGVRAGFRPADAAPGGAARRRLLGRAVEPRLHRCHPPVAHPARLAAALSPSSGRRPNAPDRRPAPAPGG